MKLAFLDLETTGLDIQNEEITEVAVVVQDFGMQKHCDLLQTYVYTSNEKYDNIPKIITDLTKITSNFIKQYGIDPCSAISAINSIIFDADYVVAHNGKGYDKPLLEAFAARHGLNLIAKPWIDTASDIEWNYRYNNQSWIAMEQGFLNPFPHDALSDVMTLKRIFNTEITTRKQLDELIEYSQAPDITVVANVTYTTNKLAKDRKYRWNPEKKIWWKLIKEFEYERESQEAPFSVTRQGNPAGS